MLLRQKKKGGQVFPCPIPSLLIFHLINPDSLPISHLCSTSLSPITTNIPLYAPPLYPQSLLISHSMLHLYLHILPSPCPCSTLSILLPHIVSPFPPIYPHFPSIYPMPQPLYPHTPPSLNHHTPPSLSPYPTISIPIPHPLCPHTPLSLSMLQTGRLHNL